MSEKADGTTADWSIVAKLCAVAGRVQPILKYVVRIRAPVSADTVAHFFHVWASNACVIVGPRIPADRFFACMGKWTHCPVMYETFGARNDLQGAKIENI